MITVFCGNNQSQSRQQFAQAIQNLEKEGKTKIVLHADTSSMSSLESSQLFGGEQFFCGENLLSTKPVRDIVKTYSTSQDTHILIWESKLDDKAIKKHLPQAKILASTIPVNIWHLLDGLYPGNAKAALRTLQQLNQSDEAGMLLFMIQQRAKELILVGNNLPGKFTRAGWQESKLLAQSKRWQPERLEQFYSKLLDIESGIKSGIQAYDIKRSLDILFCFYLQ